MGGFFGVVSESDCISDVFYGTDYHSHLGTRRGGLAVIDDDGRITRKIHDITNSQFRSKFDEDLAEFCGRAGIGVISDFEDQPLVISGKLGTFAIATVGKINNINAIVNNAFDSGHTYFSESTDGEPNPTEVTAMLICSRDTLVEGIEYAQRVIDGSCSILVLLNGAIYAARDRYGRTPVIVGRREGAFAVAMESTSFPNLDYEVVRELGPGEIVELTASNVTRLRAPGKTMKMCSFFWVYYGYPSSCYEGVNTESARYRNGASLAEGDRELIPNIDLICGIPDSGIANAILGTLEITFGAALIGIPPALLGGIYLAEFGRGTRLAGVIRFAANVLMGMPSVVVGLFVYAVMVVPLGGFSGMAGSLALAILMIPVVLSTTEEMLRMVPDTLRESALALGCSRARATLAILCRSARSGLLTGILLAVARVSGETAPLLFTALWSDGWPRDYFTGPTANLPVLITEYSTNSPFAEQHAAGWGAALTVTAMVLILNVGSRIIFKEKHHVR